MAGPDGATMHRLAVRSDSWGAFTPLIDQELLQMRAPVGPVVAAGDLPIAARPTFLLEQSDEAQMRRDEARLVAAEFERIVEFADEEEGILSTAAVVDFVLA